MTEVGLAPEETGASPSPRVDAAIASYSVEPATLEDLRKRAGDYAEAATQHVEWSAVTTWLMNGDADTLLTEAGIPGDVASVAVFHVRRDQEQAMGWPVLSSRPVIAAFDGFSPEFRCTAYQVADEIHALWEAANRPCLTARACAAAFRYLVACVNKGTIGPIPSLGDAAPGHVKLSPQTAAAMFRRAFLPKE